ncbi:probable E3 ubiquitin-protein ligase makorin-1 [Melanerpes formicivorus]|uniref:probable E3 ubiquitin-protein ligase makorin-1 n=1 Tax=Melanerpes formicivorus TaxID=211600 RepID=UPI00358FB3FD
MESGSLMASGTLRARGGSVRPLCRNFARGFCRWGQSCHFSHDRKSAQVCRYFQSGFCSHGERCGYDHLQEQPVPVGTYCGSAPTMLPARWGLEHSYMPVAVAQGWGGAQCGTAEPGPNVTHLALKFASMEVKKEKKGKENSPAPDNITHGAIDEEFAIAEAQGASGSQLQQSELYTNSSDPGKAVAEAATWTDPAEMPLEPGTAAAAITTAALRARSEALVCGICMDRVYEKPLPEERLFGILPNCSHTYCVGCIRKWRRSRDFQSAVIKACPECRITSSYYIPHKYWVSDAHEKEKLIQTFKARMGKIRCKFFVQNRGRCPFKSDCIYRHELPAGRLPRHRRQGPAVSVECAFVLESSGEEDEELCVLEWALSSAETGF